MTTSIKLPPKVLVVSVRAFRFQAANCSLYEFEDFLCQHLNADLYTPSGKFDVFRKVYRLTRYLTGSDKLAETLSFFPHEITPEQDYDLVLVVADNAWQMHMLNSIRGWRERCRIKAFYVNELYPANLDNWRLQKEPFKNYDYLFTGVKPSLERLRSVTGQECNYFPPAVDMDHFNPFPNPPPRTVNATYIGRRDPVLHQGLRSWATPAQHFYYYDTIRAQKLFIDNHVEHRQMYANLLKRSVYSFAMRAKFNSTFETGGADVIGSRYYEFVSTGTIIIGWKSDSDQFAEEFGWTDSVISFNPAEDNIEAVLNALENDPERRRQISIRNVANSLKRHDWSHRTLSLLSVMGMDIGDSLNNRISELAKQAEELLAQLPAEQ